MTPDPQTGNDERYWKANLRLVALCLALWFVVSYGCGILFADSLNRYQFFGFPLGFWFAQQGSIFVFLGIIFFYATRMNALDRRHAPEQCDDEDAAP